jgi:hypothetical protein
MMKTLFITIMVATLACASAMKILAQEAPNPPAPPTPVVIVHDAQKLAEDAVHRVQGDVEKQMGQIHQRLSDFRERVHVMIQRGNGAGKSMVVRSSDMAAREQMNLEEDLTVMAHILDKALGEKFADDQPARVAMGINVAYAPDDVPTRSLYLDGYGALFFLRVNFPLLAPPSEKNVEKEKAQTDSTWEEARQEVYGQPGAKNSDSAREYDAGKVSALQKALLDSLKDASNIRNVRSDESITVCVIGAPMEMLKSKVTNSGGGMSSGGGGFGGGGTTGGGGFAVASGPYAQNVWYSSSGRDDAPQNKTTLTIRVKKSDCEAFAKGKLTEDEFHNRAVVRIYGDAVIAP